MRFMLSAVAIGACFFSSSTPLLAQEVENLRAEIARLQTEVADLRKTLGDMLAATEETKRFAGTWMIESALQEGKEIPGERGGEIEFFGNVVVARFPGRKESIRQTFVVYAPEKQLSFHGTGAATHTSLDYFHGRYERDGDHLRISLLGYGVPGDVSDRNFQRLWVLKRKKE